MIRFCHIFGFAVLLAGCSSVDDASMAKNSSAATNQSGGDRVQVAAALENCEPLVHPESWPKLDVTAQRDPETEKKIQDLLARMTLEEKVGQILQGDIAFITPKEAKKYHIGSILNGGNSAPNGNNHAPAPEWLALADQFWLASVDKSGGRTGIPLLWGTDAVHGHNNIIGATLFPHNIGLGAANDVELIKKIAHITAKEIRVTGMDWTFAPTIAVARNPAWGRTYESYSENPALVKSYAGVFVQGLQGESGSAEFLKGSHLISTAKHFVGDGATVNGIDQGDARVSEADLRDIHAAGYPPAIEAGVQTVMASFNSWCGKKMHGNKDMLTTVLRDRLGFDGFVVGDWNGHRQVEGCLKTSCPQAFNAGLDMFMASDSWRPLYHNTIAQVKKGEISMARLDEAVSRILRVKFRAGLFDAKKPSERVHAGDFALLGSKEHRAVAREAVRKSLVLLKNNNNLLPLMPRQTILVAGPGADDMGMQTGGWTLNWQGTGNEKKHFPGGQSIYDGIKAAVSDAGGSAVLSVDGDYTAKPDVAIVVFGEEPYAEFKGDIPHLDFSSEVGLQLLRKFKQDGVPTVAVFLSGRPLWVNPEINASDAFVVAWLPGVEGGGVADVLVRRVNERFNYDFVGRLPFSWPAKAITASGYPAYPAQFALGYGLSYSDKTQVASLSEEAGLDGFVSNTAIDLIAAGSAASGFDAFLSDLGGAVKVLPPSVSSPQNAVSAQSVDDVAQDDTLALEWKNAASFYLANGKLDMARLEKEGFALEIRYRVFGDKVGNFVLNMQCGDQACSPGINIGKRLEAHLNKGLWEKGELGLSCFRAVGVDMAKVSSPLLITSESPTRLHISEVKLVKRATASECLF